VGATLSDRQEALDRLLAEFAIGGPIALLVMSVAGWLLGGAALRPVERMREEAAAISASELDRRLPVPAADEERARLARTREQVSLATIVRDACDGRRALADARGISVVVEAADGTAPLDPVRLRQAVENLVDNAIRHSPRGTAVHVTAGREDGRAWVRVEDA